MKLKTLSTAALFSLLCAISAAGTIEKKFPDGTLKVKYVIDDMGNKEGLYQEFYPTGKPKVKAQYKNDQQEGPTVEYHENGKPHVTANYKEGKLTGTYSEVGEKGEKLLTAVYKEGKLNGTLTRFEMGKPILTQVYKDGEVAYPRGLDQIKKKIAEIYKGVDKTDDMQMAFRKLQVYRYLVDVPYENMTIDEELNKGASAGASICKMLGMLDHMPKNPGLPEAEYKTAFNACKSSNLGMGDPKLNTIMDAWIGDSDDSNIKGLGHRRWCLNPPMQKVGFGRAGAFTAMWIMDKSQKNVPDFDTVMLPPRGLMPAELFPSTWAWNVSLNPKYYKAPDEATLKIKVFEVDSQLRRQGEVKLNLAKTSNQGFAIPFCIVFRPDKITIAPGKRFEVEITGLARSNGAPANLRYIVDFVRLN